MTFYILSVLYYLLIALDAHMFSDNGNVPRTRPQKLGPPGPGTQQLGPWSRASIMAEHMCIKGNQQAIPGQCIIGDI